MFQSGGMGSEPSQLMCCDDAGSLSCAGSGLHQSCSSSYSAVAGCLPFAHGTLSSDTAETDPMALTDATQNGCGGGGGDGGGGGGGRVSATSGSGASVRGRGRRGRRGHVPGFREPHDCSGLSCSTCFPTLKKS